MLRIVTALGLASAALAAAPVLHCAHCEQEVRPGELRVRPGEGANKRQLAEPLLPLRG